MGTYARKTAVHNASIRLMFRCAAINVTEPCATDPVVFVRLDVAMVIQGRSVCKVGHRYKTVFVFCKLKIELSIM